MKVTYVSCVLNSHIRELCKELYILLEDGFKFIATNPTQKNINTYKMGMAFYQSSQENNINFIWYKEIIDGVTEKECQKIIDKSDVVIIANASDVWIKQRLKVGKLTFRAHERWYRKKLPLYRIPKAMIGGWLHHSRYRNLYMLTASAYTAADTAMVGCFREKSYCWGYFPETKKYGLEKIEQMKKNQKPILLWAGRLIDWKHAEDAIHVCRYLRDNEYDFELRMIGDGPEKEKLENLCRENNLLDIVTFMGILSTAEVRKHMEQANIFLFTSDFQEGWGVVLNEAMNSCCAVVASHAIGSVPYLIDDKKNGYIYQSGNIKDLYQKVLYLLDNPGEMEKLGKNAYYSIVNEWNAKNAAQRFLVLCQSLLKGEYTLNLYSSGVCSKAPLIKNDWYK